jgi:hypothetical protein
VAEAGVHRGIPRGGALEAGGAPEVPNAQQHFSPDLEVPATPNLYPNPSPKVGRPHRFMDAPKLLSATTRKLKAQDKFAKDELKAVMTLIMVRSTLYSMVM